MTEAVPVIQAPPQRQSSPRTRLVRGLVIVGLLLPVAMILLVFGSRMVASTPGRNGPGINNIGQLGQWKVRPAPEVWLQYYDGREGRLLENGSSLTVLNFWGSWCAPCRQEAPVLEGVASASRDQGVRFVGVSLWDADAAARGFLQQYRITYANAPDPNGRLAIELGVTGIPETFFINAQGQIVQRWVGPLTEDRLWALIDQVRAPSNSDPTSPS